VVEVRSLSTAQASDPVVVTVRPGGLAAALSEKLAQSRSALHT
jgi:hypothetical protein